MATTSICLQTTSEIYRSIFDGVSGRRRRKRRRRKKKKCVLIPLRCSD
jgi:hypothetical protein